MASGTGGNRVPNYEGEVLGEENTRPAAAQPPPQAPGTPPREAVGGVGVGQNQENAQIPNESTTPHARDPSVRTLGVEE